MIRYAITVQALNTAIAAEDPNWRNRTRQRTAACRRAKKFKGVADWSPIKAAYVKLQHSKCCYCEKRLEEETYGLGEHDVEHFRPKSAVRDWLTAAIRKEIGMLPKESRNQASKRGYYLLAYHPLNYAAACRTCNSSLKGSHFPILGRRRVTGAHPHLLQTSERPLLIYPVSDIDEDPEQLIRFEGIVAIPVAASVDRERHLRARGTIRFFHLNTGAGRELLVRDRAEVIDSAWKSLRIIALNADQQEVAEAKADLVRMNKPSQPHANCVRSFLRLYQQDANRARAIWLDVKMYLKSQ